MNDRRIVARAAASEPLTIEGLPAGEYLAVAISDAALGSLERPDAKLLERLRQGRAEIRNRRRSASFRHASRNAASR